VASPYVAILRSRLAAQRVYGTSFAFDVAGSVFFGLIELAEVWIIFHNVRSLGGLTYEQVILLFGLTHTGYAASQILVGHVDRMPVFLRSGTLDTLYLRPLSLLGQVITSEIALRRMGWLTVGVLSLGYGLVVNEVAWTPTHMALLAMTLITSTAIFSALFVAAGSLQFFLIDGAEATNAFTYGGRYASQQPTSILPGPLLLLFTFVVPVAFTGYLPTLALLDLPAPDLSDVSGLSGLGSGLGAGLAWAGPLAAAVAWLIAGGLWRLGVRHYQGGGG
jgi:viologen exporter family transport system permease protein